MRWLIAAGAALTTMWRLVGSPRVDPPAVADAIVALDGDRPRRLRAAVALAASGYAPVLVVVRAENAAPELLNESAKYPFEVVALNPDPPTTRGEARGIARLATDRSWKRIVVVTSTFHITRARLIFGRSVHCETSFVGAGMARRRLPRHILSESAKLPLALTLRRAP